MQRLVRDEGGVIIPVFGMDIAAASKKIGFYKPAVNLEHDGLRAAQCWWFKLKKELVVRGIYRQIQAMNKIEIEGEAYPSPFCHYKHKESGFG